MPMRNSPPVSKVAKNPTSVESHQLLELTTDHFHDFFNTVVDPEWLHGNDEEARALRQTMTGRANKVWRVLHRVTYVERPALMGFGRDLR
jgi:hypothetical protein